MEIDGNVILVTQYNYFLLSLKLLFNSDKTTYHADLHGYVSFIAWMFISVKTFYFRQRKDLNGTRMIEIRDVYLLIRNVQYL